MTGLQPGHIVAGGTHNNNNAPTTTGANLFDLIVDADNSDRLNPLDSVSEEKMMRIKRGLWFIVRGQKINTIDGVADFFEQVKEEMSRQQLREETEAAGGTANFIESMVTSMATGSRPSTAQDPFGSSFNSSTSSSNGSFRRGGARVAASRAQNGGEDNGEDEAEQAAAERARAERQARAEQEEYDRQEREAEEQAAELKRQEVEAATQGRLPPIVKARTVLDYAIETAEQKEQRAITEFIESWADTVSLCIVMSQLFVLYSTGIHAGFNQPVTVTSICFDKIFGDLVAIACIIYRCVAPFKEYGMWQFDWKRRTWRYLTSGNMLIELFGVVPLDLIGYSLGSHCALTRPDRCAVVGGHWQLNRLAQCWGMFTNFGSVAETLFLRRGLHPILGRVAEVFLYLVCMSHFVACSFNLLLSRGDSKELYTFFDAGFDNQTLAHQYFLVSDWAMKSLIGLSPRGSSFPEHGWDQTVVILITVVGVSMFTLTIATVKLYFDRDVPEKAHAQLVDETLDMVQYMKLEDSFRDECLNYFNHMFHARFHLSGMKDFEDDLAGGLARKMRFVVGRELVGHIPLLRSLQDNEPFIVSLMQRIAPMVLPPDTIIFKREELGSTMLVIIKGIVKVLSPEDDTSVVALLGSGKVVGEVALLMDAPRTATVVSGASFINALSLDRKDMGELIMLFPEIAPILMQQMAERMQQLAAAKKKKEEAVKKKVQEAAEAGTVAKTTT